MTDTSKYQQSRAAARRRYDQEHTRKYTMKVNTRTEYDIFSQLSQQENVQGYIKRLIREDIARSMERPEK